MHERGLFALTGLPGTGKSTSAAYLQEKYGFFVFDGSDYLKVLAQSEGRMPRTRQEYTAYYIETQHWLGKHWMTEAVQRRPEPRRLQAALRSRADFDRTHYYKGIIIGFVCPPDLCIERIDTSNPKNPSNVAEYAGAVATESSGSLDGYGLVTPWTVAHADYIIDTSGPIEDTRAALREIVEPRL